MHIFKENSKNGHGRQKTPHVLRIIPTPHDCLKMEKNVFLKKNVIKFHQNLKILMKFDDIFLPAFFMLFVPGGKFCADSADNKTESVRRTEMGDNL